MHRGIKNISLSFSCHENWDDFKTIDGSKFCEKCQHAVIDFSNATKAEFEEKVKSSQGHLCGRFKISQLSGEFLKYAAATAIVASSLSSIGCAPDVIEPTIVKKPESKNATVRKPTHLMGRFRH